MSDPPVLSPWTQFCLNTAHEDCCPVTKVTPLFERFNNIQSFLKDILLSLNSLADILRAISILWMCSLLMFNSCERITHIPHHGLPKPLSSRNKIPFLRRKMKVEDFFFFFKCWEFLLTTADWIKISQRDAETKGNDLKLPGESRSHYFPFLLFPVNTSAGGMPSERQLHTWASPAWETGFELITMSILVTCKTVPAWVFKSIFGQLRTKEMPFSMLLEIKLTTSIASPAVASWFPRSSLPVMVWMLGHSFSDADISGQ